MNEKPLVLGKIEEPILEVESNGDIVLRGKIIGNDKELADFLIALGNDLASCNKLMQAQLNSLENITKLI